MEPRGQNGPKKMQINQIMGEDRENRLKANEVSKPNNQRPKEEEAKKNRQ